MGPLLGLLVLLSLSVRASYEGLDLAALKSDPIASYTRPCCSFANSFLQHKLGLSGLYLEPAKLKSHFYLRKSGSDKVGLIYTCRGGFLDISHLRDNADWTAQVRYNLRAWLEAGLEVSARTEGSFHARSVVFPKLSGEELSALSESDLDLIAVAVGNSMALLHEIPTAFNIQKGSAFSLEDAYSNLLGSYLGVRAVRDPRPYDEAMTAILSSTLADLGALREKDTVRTHKLVKGLWWKDSFSGGFESVLKRDFTYVGSVTPFLVHTAVQCLDASPETLPVPAILSNGNSVNSYFKLRGVMKEHFMKKLAKRGVVLPGDLSQDDFPEVIEAIRLDMSSKLGADLDEN